MDADAALQAAAPHVAAIEDPLESDNTDGSDAALQNLLDIAIAFQDSSQNPMKAKATAEALAEAADPECARKAEKLVASWRAISHRVVENTGDVAVRTSIDGLNHLASSRAGLHAIHAAHVTQAAVSAIDALDDSDLVERLMRSLSDLVHLDARCRDDACEAGAEKATRSVLALWSAHERVQTAAHDFLHALAFEDAASPHANALPPISSVKHSSGECDDNDDDGVADLVASLRRQQLGDEDGESTTSTTQLSLDDATDSVLVPVSQGEEHRQQEDEDLMQLDAADSMDCGDAGAHAAAVIGPGPVQASGTATPQPPKHWMDARASCAFKGATCLGRPCSRPVPGCGHRVLCVACELALGAMADMAGNAAEDEDGRSTESGLLKPDGASRQQQLSYLGICPVCSQGGGAMRQGEEMVAVANCDDSAPLLESELGGCADEQLESFRDENETGL